MAHSYEEIREMVTSILAGREPGQNPSQFVGLLHSVNAVVDRRNGEHRSSDYLSLDREEQEHVREVFWDLFRTGVITIGRDAANAEYPFFRLSRVGKQLLDNSETYFFHDTSTFEKLILDEIPEFNQTTLLYAKESMQAFRVGCLLSSTVMIGVATEHTFNILVETAVANPNFESRYKKVLRERGILRQFTKFRRTLEADIKDMPYECREDLDTQFSGILSIIRNFRNESGHPSGKIIGREQCYVLLNLFIPYSKKMYQLIDFFTEE
jgi:hypothetical protein